LSKIPKVSKVYLIYKNANVDTDSQNLHQIHLISPIYKILENIKASQLISHLIDNNIIPLSTQGGIKVKSSTTLLSALFNLGIFQYFPY